MAGFPIKRSVRYKPEYGDLRVSMEVVEKFLIDKGLEVDRDYIVDPSDAVVAIRYYPGTAGHRVIFKGGGVTLFMAGADSQHLQSYSGCPRIFSAGSLVAVERFFVVPRLMLLPYVNVSLF